MAKPFSFLQRGWPRGGSSSRMAALSLSGFVVSLRHTKKPSLIQSGLLNDDLVMSVM